MLIDLTTATVLIAFATVLIWLACNRLEQASHNLALIYGLPEIVKGSVVMAVSSSFPELATIVLAGWLHGDFELGLAAIIGSAIFNILVIPGLSVFFRAGSLDADRDVVFRETQFYLISVTVVLLTLSFSVIYNPGAGRPLVGTLTRPLVLLPLAFYLLYLYIQYHEVRDHKPDETAPSLRPIIEWLRLIAAIVVVTVGVELLIRAAIDLGRTLQTPSYFWGITVIAAATSVPDLFMSIKAARRTIGVSSLSNVLGSNIFDLLAVVPIGVLVAGRVGINYAHAVPMMAFLILATVVILILMRRGFELTNRDATLLLIFYAGFIVLIGLDSFGVIAVLDK